MNTRMTVDDLDRLDAGQRRALVDWVNSVHPYNGHGVLAIELHPSALTASCAIGPFPVALKLAKFDDYERGEAVSPPLYWRTVYADCPPCWLVDDHMVVEL